MNSRPTDVHALIRKGAAAVAAAIAKGDVSCREATQACLDTIQSTEDSINAMMHVDAEGALASASALDRQNSQLRSPLFGVPVILKDNIDVAGMPATAGIKAYADRVPTEDSPVAANLRRGGAIILGKATLHEGAMGATNDNPFSGRTHHPLKHEFTPGGSSGGSAAAVLAGYAPLAIGSDTLGSVRVPSAYCGLCGLKPSNGNLSIAGMIPLAPELDTAGPIARTVDDLILAMRALDRTVDDKSRFERTRNWGAPVRDNLSGLTVAVVTSFDGFDIDAGIVEHYFKSLGVMVDLGARLVTFDLGKLDLGKIRRAGFIHAQLGAVSYHRSAMKADPDGFSGAFHRAAQFVENLDPEREARANATIDDAVGVIEQTFSSADLIALPTTPQTAFSFDQPVPDNQADLTALANLHGCPAVSIPLAMIDVDTDVQLPAGLQLMTRRFDDARLLQSAGAVERALAECIN